MSNELNTSLASSKANTSIARWYAVQVASSCEKKVKATLEQRSVTLGVNNRIIEIEIPQTPGIKLKKDGSRQTTEEKVFPGYVLVRMILDEDTMMAVKSTPNVINFVGAEDGRGSGNHWRLTANIIWDSKTRKIHYFSSIFCCVRIYVWYWSHNHCTSDWTITRY